MDFKQIVKGIKILLKSIFKTNNTYIISFTKESDNKWYVDFPNWPFDHHNLMMVAGADKLCEGLSYDGRHTKIEVMPTNKPRTNSELLKDVDIIAERKEYSITGGSDYYASTPWLNNNLFWLCPVTLFVLGKYPKYLYIKKLELAQCGLFL